MSQPIFSFPPRKQRFGKRPARRERFGDYFQELVEALKRKDFDHVTKMINDEGKDFGIIVSPKDF